MVIFEAFFGCHDILILGKSPIKWGQRPNMTIAVDWDFQHQFKHSNFFLLLKTFPVTLCTRDTINYLTSENDTTRRGVWRKMESGELTIILILQAFMRGSLGQELAEK